jgi:class 3 adenylate cyclase/tetratricopeptide (TPR) repeat protein
MAQTLHDGGAVVTFEELLDQAIDMLQRRGRLTYRALKAQFHLDDDLLDVLKGELIEGQRLAVDENGRVLVWMGDTASVSPPASVPTVAPATDPKPPPISYTPPYLTEKIFTARRALEGERKHVTVCFADIKDSTELIKDLDPEDAQQLLDPAIHIMMDAVHRFEGTVNQVLGDGIMALFGAPIAHEDHAARACYAALAMQAAMQDYTSDVRQTHGLTLRIRVGLNAGEVVVRTIGNDLHMDYSAVGPTTHLAARMEQLADPGSIILTASTLRLVEGFVRVNGLGPVPVKGLTEPVEVYELTGTSITRRRLQAAVARGLTRFVGRDTEIEALTQALGQAETGHGQVVATVGEAGLGKSRLFYGSLLQERRRVLHAQIVEKLEASVGSRIDEQVEQLAHHAFQGEVWDKAFLYYHQAGIKAMKQSACGEAVICFEQALEALRYLPERRETLEQAIDLRLDLRNALVPFGDWRRIQANLHEAEHLAEALDDTQRLGRLCAQLSVQFFGLGAYDEAITYNQRALALAKDNQDSSLQAWAMVHRGYAGLAQGNYALSIDHLTRAATLLEGDQTQEHFGGVIPVKLHACAWLAQCHAELGTFSDGLPHGEEGLRIAQGVDRPLSFMAAYRGLGWLYLRQGDLTKALNALERAVIICREANSPLYLITVAPALGAVYTLGGRVDEAVPLIAQALERAIAMEAIWQQARAMVFLGEAHLLAGQIEEASQCATEALQISRTHKERGNQAYALGLLGNITLHHAPTDMHQAETHYQQALALATELGMRPLQAHCHRGLGTLYRQMRQTEQARAELSTALAMYRNMAMTFWLPETEAALAEVEGKI